MIYGIEIAYPVIALVCYFTVEAIKRSAVPNEWLPLISLFIGALLGAVGYIAAPELIAAESVASAAVGGGLCGLAATGGDQVLKQITERLSGGKADK